MSIDLTEAQRQAVLGGEAVRLHSSEIGVDVVVLNAEQYEEVREILEDERQQRAFRRAGVRSAIRRLKEESP